MSLSYSIPKTATYLPTTNQFTAAFNVPTLGVYDFAVAGNQDRPVLSMNQNAIYLINRITIGGTVLQEQYLFNMALLPQMVLRYSKERQRVYPLSIPLVQFSDGQEAVAFFWTDKQGESLTMSIPSGQLSQDASLVGVASVKINISLSIFEVTDQGFIQNFKNDNTNARTGNKTYLRNSNTLYVDD